MDDLISRSAAIDALMEQPKLTRSVIRRVLRQVPEVDAVEVVRCKDCEYNFQNNGHNKNGCPIVDTHIWMDDDGFCSCGKRRADDYGG
jgi:hypothetical protein